METIENRDIQQLLHDGISQFNNGEFFEAHETLESAWRMETSPSKEVIQALIQFSVGCHHLKRKNWVGAIQVFSKARSNLVVFGGASYFVNCKEIIYPTRKGTPNGCN